ncbi:hypothetical protein DMUE_5280 [Dictyocoela muelleri]|nr:hypothetical protein DMUE_5280 [Dictyocoela muelleri]
MYSAIQLKNSADKLHIYSFQQLKNQIDDSSAFKKELIKLHCLLQHPGCKPLYNLIKKQLSVKKLFLLISEVSKNCIKCQINKYNRIRYLKISGFLYSENKNETVSSDISIPFVYYKDDFKKNFTFAHSQIFAQDIQKLL